MTDNIYTIEHCQDDDGTTWLVFHDGKLVEVFTTEEEAVAFVQSCL